jgi:hypothetical protein
VGYFEVVTERNKVPIAMTKVKTTAKQVRNEPGAADSQVGPSCINDNAKRAVVC